VPSIPGLGFSDAFQASDGLLEKTAGVFDALMKRVGYEYYLASTTGSGRDSPAGIDYWLGKIIGEKYKDSCLGVHLVEPCVERPRIGREPWGWAKFVLARFFHANLFGYGQEDWVAVREARRIKKEGETRRRLGTDDEEGGPLLGAGTGSASAYGAVGMVGLREPNTFAYALCDSPVGLLSLVCSALRRKSPQHKLSNTEIIDVTQLAWLPGPEAAARFWASAVKEVGQLEKGKTSKSRVAVTVFGSDGDAEYVCPAWANGKHDVVVAQRATGKGGLVAWERADILVQGIQELAREIELLDSRLKEKVLEQVVVDGPEPIAEATEAQEVERLGLQLDVESPDTVVAVDMS